MRLNPRRTNIGPRRHLPFDILYEDGDVIAIDKPAGLLATHTRLHGRAAREAQPTAENYLNSYLRKGQAKSRKSVSLVHRLDRDTSGVMIFAKSRRVAEAFRADWAAVTEKRYLALVEGEMEAERGSYTSFLKEDSDGYRVRSVPSGTPGAKRARTDWEAAGFRSGLSLVRILLKSGRKNQIRVQFADAGHPVAGDAKYGGRKSSRLQLHSAFLAFRHPRDGRRVEVASRMEFPAAPAAAAGRARRSEA